MRAACCALSLTLAACPTKGQSAQPDRSAESAGSSAPTPSVLPTSGTLDDSWGGSDEAGAADQLAPSGTAQFVVERVMNHCLACFEPMPDTLLGYDLLLSMVDPEKPSHVVTQHVFCPPTAPDASTTRPRLDSAQACRLFKKCEELAADALDTRRSEVACESERVVLSNDAGRTVLEGSFGRRQVADHPLRIAPVTRKVRLALHD